MDRGLKVRKNRIDMSDGSSGLSARDVPTRHHPGLRPGLCSCDPSGRSDLRSRDLQCAKQLLAAFLISLTSTGATTRAAEPAIQATYDKPTGIASITEAGKPILQYPYQTVPVPDGFFDGIPEKNLPYARKYAIPRSNYIHPLFCPDGTELTADWSKDHAHHRGIYWAWPEVQFNGETGDLHALQKVWARPTGKIETRTGGDWAELEAENRWMWEDKTPIVRETATIRAWKAGDHGRHIDLTFQFEALENGVTLARRGTKNYGGLNIRLAKIQDMKLAHHADPADAKQQAAWQMASGTWNGATEPLSMVVLEQATNPGYPGDYAEYPNLPWFQPTFPRAGIRHALEKSKPLVLRYRIWLRSGPPPGEQELRDQWKIYQETGNKRQP
jgi:hypothetical protein